MQIIFDIIRQPRANKATQDDEILNSNAELIKREIHCVIKDLSTTLNHSQYSFTIIYPKKGYRVLVDYSNLKERTFVQALDKELKDHKFKGKINNLIP